MVIYLLIFLFLLFIYLSDPLARILGINYMSGFFPFDTLYEIEVTGHGPIVILLNRTTFQN